MKRVVSIVVRRASGELAVAVDRSVIDCDDNFSGVDAAILGLKSAGHVSITVLLADDSIARHWTKEEGSEQPGASHEVSAAAAKLSSIEGGVEQVVEDLIDALVARGVLDGKDLSAPASEYVSARKALKSSLAAVVAEGAQSVEA